MKNKAQSSTSLFVMFFFFFCLAFLIMAKRSVSPPTINKTIKTGEGKDFKDWTINDLRNELKRFGEDVEEGVRRTELVRRLSKFYNDKKDSINEKKEHLKEKLSSKFKHSQHDDEEDEDKSFSDMSINDLRKELKKYGEDIAEGIKRTELVRRLRKYIHNKKDSLKDMKEDLKEKLSPKFKHSQHDDEEDEDKSFSDMSINDLRKELKQYGEDIAEGIKRKDLIKRLRKYIHNKKDSLKDMKEDLQEKISPKNKHPLNEEDDEERYYSDWSISDLTYKLGQYGEKAPYGATRDELIKRLRKYHSEDKDIFLHLKPAKGHEYVHINKAHSYNDWTSTQLRKELLEHGEKVPEDLVRSELISRLSKYHSNSKDSSEQKYNYPDVGHVHDADASKDPFFGDWSRDEMVSELRRLGEIVPVGTAKSELIKRLQKFKFNKDTFHHSSSTESKHDIDYSHWTVTELREELKKYGERMPNGSKRSDLLARLLQYKKHDNNKNYQQQQKSYPEAGRAKTDEEMDYHNWSDQNLKIELRRYGESVADGIGKEKMISNLRKIKSNPNFRQKFYPEDGDLKTEGEGAYVAWSDGDLRDELKKYGESVSDGVDRGEIIRKLKSYYNQKRIV